MYFALLSGGHYWHRKDVIMRNAARIGNRSKSAAQAVRANASFLLGQRNFRRFYAGYAVSVTGSAMASVAVAFAVLGNGGGSAALGYVFAAGVVPQVVLMITGGVLADRIGRRPVMLGADLLRFAAQSALAAALLAGTVPLWVFVVLQAAEGTGEAFFTPALTALTPELAPPGHAGDANALISLAQTTARIGGPAVAGILVAVLGPGPVLACDAASFGASVLSLLLLKMPPALPAAASPLRDLADGWAAFRTRPWLWLTTLQYTLFNLFTWAPYLLLGPILARDYLGGARAWGIIVTALAAGSVAASVALVGRRPRRPLVMSVVGSFGYPAPCLMLALHAPVAAVAAAAVVAGAGSAVAGTFWTTTLQQDVPPALQARATAFTLTGSYALGSAAYAVIGPVAAVTGPRPLLAFAAAWGLLSPAVLLALPAVRRGPAVADGGMTKGDGPGPSPSSAPVS
jgi:MFS family permease